MSKKTYLNNLTLFSWRQTGNLMAQTISKQEVILTHYFSIYGRFLRAQKTKKLNIEELSRPKFDVSEQLGSLRKEEQSSIEEFCNVKVVYLGKFINRILIFQKFQVLIERYNVFGEHNF